MSEINTHINGISLERSRALMAAENSKGLANAWDANLYRQPDYYIYIFTVSDRDFTVSQPPLFPALYIPARKKGERVSFVVKLPSPFQQLDREGAVGDLITRGHRAEAVAQSICNPNNLSLDQDAPINDRSILGFGVDLNAQGVFWSRNEKPTEDEIRRAELRRERYYRALLEKARVLEISNPKELNDILNQDFHQAAEYFHQETSWHKTMIKFEECPLCGESIKPGVAAHKNSLGGTCIIDKDRAKLMGLPTTSPASKD